MPELEQKKFQRLTAYKVRISDILSGSFVRDDILAGYIKLNGINVSRVNIIATVVYKPESSGFSSAVIDDGTGRMQLRSFENINIFSSIEVGDAVLVVGKIRDFNDEKYLIPEILKKINNFEWMNVRKLELGSRGIGIEVKNSDKIVEDTSTGTADEIYSLIKKLDAGEGVSVEDLIKKADNSKAEAVINRLLENGDIFEVMPGKLKVLE
ncbi:hypothetical protein HYY71_02460 [Candidatus Woesearchaeota archaeon]|nr:hypothetical protein [Candidatus Woesearchaeota archaeon]